MWRWVLTFLVVSIVAGLYIITGRTAGEVGFAKVFIFIFMVCLGISVVAWLTAGRRHRA
jgi:uncharacterized membrane protein YtjA (UPF0391 family)